jgi:hypothetical protein
VAGRPAKDLEQFAAKLGRPATALSELNRLTPEQVRFLGEAVDAACARERRSVESGLGRAIPRPLLAIVLRALRG